MTAVRPSAMTEKDLARFVADTARHFGWRRYHTHRSDFSPAGWPDEALVRGHQLILAELKSDKAKVSPAQQEWLDALAQVTQVAVRLWRPADQDDIETLLSGGRIVHNKPGPPHAQGTRKTLTHGEYVNVVNNASFQPGNQGGRPART